jgi:hypothetical protein
MSTGFTRRADQAGKATPPLGQVLLATFVVGLVVVYGALLAFGPEIRASQDAGRARIIAEEDRTFCARFGTGPETDRYAECSAALKGIRARHEERILSDHAGIL